MHLVQQYGCCERVQLQHVLNKGIKASLHAAGTASCASCICSLKRWAGLKLWHVCRVRDEISDLSEKYSMALSEHETSNAVVQEGHFLPCNSLQTSQLKDPACLSIFRNHPRILTDPVPKCMFCRLLLCLETSQG